MNFLHYEINASAGDTVLVHLTAQANVRLLDDLNYARYRSGSQHQYFGGRATVSPTTVQVPRTGKWHVVIDLGGYSGNVSASVSVI